MVNCERAINSSIDKAPSHSAEIENLHQEDSDAECIACGQGSLEPKQKRRKASTHPAAAMQNVGATAPLQIGSNAYPTMWVPKHQCLQVGVVCNLKGAHGCSSKEAGG